MEGQQDLTTLSNHELASMNNDLDSKSSATAEHIEERTRLMLEIARRGSLLPEIDIDQQKTVEKEKEIVERMEKALKLARPLSDGDNNMAAILAVEIYRELK